MDHKPDVHIVERFLEYHENKLSESAMHAIEEHLGKCKACASYYRVMSEVVMPAEREVIPEIELDPYLPSRVKALVESGGSSRPLSLRHRWVMMTLGAAAFCVAIGIGIILGKGLGTSTYTTDNASIATTYLEAFTQRGFGDYLQTAIDSTKGVQ
jgi:predicted anti-sigma-YlaC factor YlaD